jgi:hypothetical protein
MMYDASASWTNTNMNPAGTTVPNDNREEQVFTSPFPATITSNSSLNPFDQMNNSQHQASLSGSNLRDPDINSEVQDYARELSLVLLTCMPSDLLTPLMARLHLRPSPSLTIPTQDLLGLPNELPHPFSVPTSEFWSINPFDALTSGDAPFGNYQSSPPHSFYFSSSVVGIH